MLRRAVDDPRPRPGAPSAGPGGRRCRSPTCCCPRPGSTGTAATPSTGRLAPPRELAAGGRRGRGRRRSDELRDPRRCPTSRCAGRAAPPLRRRAGRRPDAAGRSGGRGAAGGARAAGPRGGAGPGPTDADDGPHLAKPRPVAAGRGARSRRRRRLRSRCSVRWSCGASGPTGPSVPTDAERCRPAAGNGSGRCWPSWSATGGPPGPTSPPPCGPTSTSARPATTCGSR